MIVVKVILKIDNITSVVVSAAISVGYTLIGGMISVAYTDVFQLFFIAFGLVRKLTHLV
jgi:high affinity choline transporter 7